MDAIERAGMRCWIADRDIKVATSYPAAIGAAIKECGALVLLLTEASNASPHVLREVELAFNSRRPILPIRIAHTTPSADLQYFLSTSQWLDTGTSFDDEDIAKVEPVLRDLLEHGKGGHLGPVPGSTRWLWVGGTAALALIVLMAVVMWPRPATIKAPVPAASSSPVTRSGPADAERPSRQPEAASTASVSSKVNPADGQTYVWIPPGRFTMGCSDGDTACNGDEKPVHSVSIKSGFWLARTEVTDGQYRSVMSAGRASRASDSAASDLPVVGVDWATAKRYCTRVGGRLPTEAEWEYAARAGSTTRYYDDLDAIAWFDANSGERPHPAGKKMPNAFGLYDMLGNVSEWVLDRYYNAYDDTSDPAKPDEPLAGNASAVVRGGSWVSDGSGVRVSRRLEMPPDAQEPHVGFRCAADRP